MLDLNNARNSILQANDIAIAGHINPDGDSIGSLLSLGLSLEKLGKRVYMISPDGVPQRYKRLPGAAKVVRSISKPVDLAIAVDCGSKDILGSAYRSFESAKSILEIDHHEFRKPFGDVKLIDKKAAAVGELVYILLKSLRAGITRRVAQNLMTSIIVETNSFRLPSVRPFTFEVCSDLVKVGVNFYDLVEMVFWSRRKESAILSGLCLARCKFAKAGRLVWSSIHQRDFDRLKGKDEDVDPVPDEMRSIKNVKVAVLFREKSNHKLRVSLRSKGRINVAKIAEYYGGGGHFDVAGCVIPNKMESVRGFLKRAAALLE